MNRGVVILDGDGTLWRTQELYDNAKNEFESLLKEHRFHSTDIIRLVDKIDARSVSKQGFSKGRFAKSLLTAYRQLCDAEGIERDSSIELTVKQIGNSVFALPKLYEDTEFGLKILKDNYMLVLATKGERSIQNQRIQRLGLRNHFARIYNLREKTEKEYCMIVSDLGVPVERLWVIGNSVKSDINPALTVGLRSILIPRETWIYEEDTLKPGDVIEAGSLKEAVEIILSRDGLTSILADPSQGDTQ